jgi:hypothetical protein
MMSDRLKNFLSIWCDVDADQSEVTRILQAYPNHGFSPWLKEDLQQAIEDREFDPDVVYRLTTIGFDNQEEVDEWLRESWAAWFPEEPYPE